MAAGHRAAGALAGATMAGAVASSPWQAGVVLCVAVATSAGGLSPDLDQTRVWRVLTGGRGVAAHRCVTHWWALPAVLAVVAPSTPDPAVAWGVAAGWGSHVVADAVIGARSARRGPGVPLLPGAWHVGLGVRCGGRVEGWATMALRWLAVGAVGAVTLRMMLPT